MDADKSINECILCKEHLKDKHPKLLSCLHSVCETCFKTLFKTIDVSESKKNEETSEQGEKSETIEDDVKVDNKGNEKTGPREENWLEIKEINCPVCDTIVNKEYVVENLFALTDDVTKQTSGEDEEDMIIEKNEVHICTGCEEEQAAASFCEDCREWLCDQCVFAHRRVRITKDHTITLKAEGSKDEDSASNRGMAMFCQKHKNEPLKLFCETCDLLTCRDCQLLEHKDHKYQFMSDAIIHQRELLQDVVTKVKTKLNNYTQAEKILQKKNDELKGKLDEVCTNITEVTQTVVKKLEEHSDMLIQHLSKYISGKVNVIGDKMRLVKEAILKMDHVVHFVDNALTLGDDMSILYTKGTMMKVLEQLGKTGIPFQHAILQYSVSFEYDKESIAKNTCGVGHLVIDNVRYPSKSGASVTANVVAPTQTMNNNNSSSSIVPRNVPRHTVQPVLPNITMLPEEVQNHILSLPAEKQHETALKLQAAYNKNRPMQQSLPSNSAFPNVGSGSTHAPQSARGYGSMSVPMNTPPFRPRTSNTFLGNQLQRPQNIFGSNYTSSPGQASQYAPRPMHPQGMHPGPISTYATAGITTNPMSAMAASVGGASLVSHGNMSFSANSNAISHPLTSNLSGFQQETILNNRHQVADTCSFSREQGSWYSHVDTNSQSRTSPLQSSQQRFSPGSLEPRSAHVHKTSVPPTGPQNPISPVAPTFAKQDHNERPSCAFNQVRASKRVLGLLLKKVTSGKRNLLSEGAKFQMCEKPVSLQKRNLSSDRVECKECGKTFSIRSNLNRHLNSCHRKLRFRCLKCNRRYGYLTNLKRHEKVCLKQKNPKNIRTKFVLEKISSVKGNLSSSGAKNEECEKSFSFKSGNLLSEVVYTCQECGKTYPAQNENLSSVGAHCQECGNTSLPRNENLSSDGFECKECGKTYSRRSGLNRHFNSCHRKLRFRCLKCKKGYGYLTSLKRHEKICFKRKTHKTKHATAAPQRSSPMPPPIPQPPPLVRKQTPPPQQPVRNEPSPSPSKVSAGGGKTMPESATFDPNEDYCAVCQNGGDLLCCDICPKVFHLKCHVPELDTYPSGDWCCSLCTKKDDQQILVEKEKKEDFYLATGKRKAPSGLSDRELKACERILLGLYCHPNSTVFHQQVSKSVPNYYKIIVNPMDFGKIKLKLQRQNFNHYSTVEEFLSDIHLVFKNCRIYNDIASEIWKIGKKVEEEAEELIRLYMPCYSDYFDELLDREDKERRAGLLGLDSIMKTFHPDETRQETPTPDTVPSSVADSQFAKKQRVEEVHEEIL